VINFSPSAVGYFGKLPALGDFCTGGLPESFVGPWDQFCRDMLLGSRAQLGSAWEAAWMEAPIWRFLLPPGACGPLACCGVWLPSVDRVGRHYPFAVIALGETSIDLEECATWLDIAEATALSGILDDAPHHLFPPRLHPDSLDIVIESAARAPGWWTTGNARVAARHWPHPSLPDTHHAGALLADIATETL
jgi:type VI secretion system protein ImpM